MSARLRSFLDEVRAEFLAHEFDEEAGCPNDLINAAIRVLDRHPRTMVLELLEGIYLSLELEDLVIGPGEVDLSGTPQDILHDLIYVVVRQVLRDEDRPEGWQAMEDPDGQTAREDKRRIRLSERRSQRRRTTR